MIQKINFIMGLLFLLSLVVFGCSTKEPIVPNDNVPVTEVASVTDNTVLELKNYVLNSFDKCSQKNIAIAKLGAKADEDHRKALIEILESNLSSLCIQQAASTSISIGDEKILLVLDELSVNHNDANARYAARMAASMLREKHKEFQSAHLDLQTSNYDSLKNTFQLDVITTVPKEIKEADLSLMVPEKLGNLTVKKINGTLIKDFKPLKSGIHTQTFVFQVNSNNFIIPIRAKLHLKLGTSGYENVESTIIVTKNETGLAFEQQET
jgi:hypothetical protein